MRTRFVRRWSAPRTIRNIRSVCVKEFEAVVENDHATQFRVNVEISVLLDEEADAGSDVFLRAAHGTGPDAAALRSGGFSSLSLASRCVCEALSPRP
jgi:Dodecin